jgi:hypothetical protein
MKHRGKLTPGKWRSSGNLVFCSCDASKSYMLKSAGPPELTRSDSSSWQRVTETYVVGNRFTTKIVTSHASSEDERILTKQAKEV